MENPLVSDSRPSVFLVQLYFCSLLTRGSSGLMLRALAQLFQTPTLPRTPPLPQCASLFPAVLGPQSSTSSLDQVPVHVQSCEIPSQVAAQLASP